MEGTVHFVGIGGIGMSAIARILLSRGERVSGSDNSDSPLLRELAEAGAQVHVGHDAQNVNGAREIVVSSAIEASNPEYRAAQERGIPVVRRGEMLARMLNARRGIAICGTHGKTTTTAMTACILRESGVDASLVLGGIDVVTKTNAHDGASPWFLSEADESDGSFALLDATIAVVTNIENDHLASDDELPKLVAAFDEFLRKLPEDGCAIVGIDNVHSASLVERERRAPTVTFGFSAQADLRPSNVRFAGLGSTFDVLASGVCLGTVELAVPGEINIANALAAIGVARRLEIPFARIAAGLKTFRGVRRRFEITAQSPRMTVVDDYAHHPTAVRETIAAARRYHRGPLIVAFQPHRYSRTAYLAKDFAKALVGADTIYLTPVYAASEPALPGVSERSIGEPLRAAGGDVRYVSDVRDLPARLLTDAPEGALVLMLGAGTISKMAHALGAQLEARI